MQQMKKKKRFLSEGEKYLKNIWVKQFHSDSVSEAQTPHTNHSAASFFNESFEGQTTSAEISIDNELKTLRLDSFNGKLDVFWRTRRNTYPCLFKVARYLLCCPATSVPSERLFSSCSDQIWAKRNKLSAESFEKIMLIYKNI